MVKTALVAMTLLGCDCDAKVCQFVYRDAAAVRLGRRLRGGHADAMCCAIPLLDYPLITGQCRVTGEPGVQLAEATAPMLPHRRRSQPSGSRIRAPPMSARAAAMSSSAPPTATAW